MVTYPSDWNRIKLNEVFTPYGGLSGKSKEDFIGGDCKYISYLDVFNNIAILQPNSKVIISNGENQNIVEYGDLLFTQSSETPDEVGMASTYLGHEKVYLNSFCFGAKPIKEINPLFFSYYLRSKYIRDLIIIQGQGSTRYNISPQRLLSIELAVPSYYEQQSIADTLSTFDEHIENLTKLIEKKRAIRDGALKDLVTGKTRLDGFESHWKTSRLETLTKQIITGGTPSTAENKYWGGEIPWLSSTEIHQKRIKNPTSYITEAGLKNSSAKMAPPYSVVVALAGQGKTRGTVAILEREMALNQSLAAIVANESTDFTFLYYALEKGYEALRELSSGDGGRGGLNKKILREFEIIIPSSKTEQQAISSILTAMDDELIKLEHEKEKIQQIKEGAMDDLLTGKIRLVQRRGHNG
ncbi:MAG TPA: hypothetical protein GX736_03465 [Mogibacterium sp.]|nr:hypothetical protein [Mogibacterium sp.]